jgi:hypothetical protein
LREMSTQTIEILRDCVSRQIPPGALFDGFSMTMRTPEDVFSDFAGRRQGILTALTAEVDRFYDLCNPERENLCLYGNPDSSWEVDLPAEEVPPEMPEPALGINFARDGMQVSADLRRAAPACRLYVVVYSQLLFIARVSACHGAD